MTTTPTAQLAFTWTHQARRTYKYRLYPNKTQGQALDAQLGEACRLYNACLQERRDAYTKHGVSVSYYTQKAQLKDIRREGLLGIANYQVAENILRRVDLAFQAFFRRVKAGETPGYPRFKSRRRFDSVTYPIYTNGCKLTGTRLFLQGIGHIKVKLHRPVDGEIRTVTIKRECGKWYVCFSLVLRVPLLPELQTSTGIDVGLTAFATLAHGEEIPNPRYARRAQAQLRIAQRRVARRKRGGKNRRKAVLLVQKAHKKIYNQRNDFHHKVARKLVDAYGVIAVEDLNIKGLAGGMLAKSVTDAGWSAFLNILSYKAVEAGRQVVYVNPSGTSQVCLCGSEVPKTLSHRWHDCPDCGLSAPRDHVSAQLIERLGLSRRA